MVSAGGSSSSSSSSQDMAAMGLGPLIGLGAFGGQFGANQGGISVTDFPTSISDAWLGGGQVNSLADLLKTLPLGLGEQLGLAGAPSQMALGALGNSNQSISQLLANLVGAGQPTDIGPIVDASRQFLGGERARLREEMGGQGSFDTDIYNAYARAEGNAATQLGTLAFQSQEAAKDRAAPGLTSGVAGAGQQINNILQTFGGLFDLEGAARSAYRSESPGGRVAEILTWLAGLQGPVGNVGSSESDSTSANVGIMSCWGAAVYYGWFTEEWWNARTWIMDGWNTLQGRLFREFYINHGEALAEIMRADTAVRDCLRPLFTWFEQCGKELRYGRD